LRRFPADRLRNVVPKFWTNKCRFWPVKRLAVFAGGVIPGRWMFLELSRLESGTPQKQDQYSPGDAGWGRICPLNRFDGGRPNKEVGRVSSFLLDSEFFNTNFGESKPARATLSELATVCSYSNWEVTVSKVNRIASVAFLWLAFIGVGVGQDRDTDSQTLRQILAELRAIHEDMRVTETTQLLVAEFETQQSVVNRATENVDNARSKLNENRLDQKQVAADLDRTQELLDKATNEDERNGLVQGIDQHKSNLAVLKTLERDLTATLQEMEQRLQNAQDKLETIESDLNAAISRLSPTPKDATQK